MEKKSFENYRIEDFVIDESFINYHFRTNERDRISWEHWLTENPSKKLLAAEAGKIIESLALALNEKEYQHEYKKIKLAITDKGPRPLFRFLNWDKISHSGKRKKKTLQYLLTGFLFLSAGAAYLLTQHPENKTAQLNNKVNNSGYAITFTLSDSTIVTLAPHSSLQYPLFFEGKNRQVYLQGEAGFHVKRNEQFPFMVHAKNIVTTVLGTIFNIKKQGDSAIVVQLLKGKVKVEIEGASNPTINPIVLYPDEKATYVFNDKHFYKDAVPSAFNVAFRQDSFEEMAARIKTVFGKTVINNSGKKNWRFTGEFKNTTAAEIIENVCLVKNLSCKVAGDTIFINN